MRAAGTFVRDLLRGRAGDPDGVDPDVLAGVVRHHRVGPSVDHLLKDAPDAGAVAHLRAATRPAVLAQVARQLPLQLDLRLVADALRGSPWAVVKGPAVAATVHAGAPREFHDLDVLVSPAAFGDALRALEARGARAMDPDWAGIRAARAGEIAVALPHGTFLDLHWHLVNRPARRQRFAVDVDAMLDRTRPATLLGTAAPVLDATDQLHHLALHACLSGAWRLLWSYDLRLASRDADWAELAARTASADTGLAVAMALSRARQVLDAPVPGRALRALSGGSPWRIAGRLATTLRPPHASPRPARNGAVVYQCTAASGSASVLALLGETHRRLRRPAAPGDPEDAGGTGIDLRTPADARTGYLEDVAAQGTDRGGRLSAR